MGGNVFPASMSAFAVVENLQQSMPASIRSPVLNDSHFVQTKYGYKCRQKVSAGKIQAVLPEIVKLTFSSSAVQR